jgi:predicted transcriptional regulator
MVEPMKTVPKESMTVTTTIALSDQLYRRLRMAALDERRKAAAIVRDALTEYFDRREKAKGARS